MRNYTIPLIVLFIFLAGACSTEKNTVLTRAYHNLTAHYNVYFNGAQSFKKGTKRVRENISDNYTTLLPVFKATKEEVPSAVGAHMDKAIKKSVKLIKTHSIKVKPKRKSGWLSNIGFIADYREQRREEFRGRNEYCDWVDDAYLLMGKAHYYKHDFTGAINALKILERNHKYSDLQERGYLWQAKCYLEMEYYDDAKIYIDKLSEASDLPQDLKVEYHKAYASYYIQKEQYNKALTELEEGLGEVRRKRDKARHHYLMAQLSQRIGNSATALDYYARVIEENPPYEMAFQAKINQALAFKGGKRSEAIKQDLRAMLKDEKNKEYLDQIYYALANIEKQEGDTRQALAYFKKAAQEGPPGSSRKGMIYLELGDMYYKKEEYQTSAAYYDTTMNFLSDQYANYEQIRAKAESLGELARNLQVASREDSLQHVAQLPEKEQMRIINNLIDQEKRKQEAQKRAGQNARTGSGSMYNQGYNDRDQMLTSQPRSSGNKFYFYNRSMVGRGITEFEKRWGSRELEDHWRRSNKSATAASFGEQQEEQQNQKQGDKLTAEYYKQDLPVTDSMMQVSEERRMEAIYRAGIIYKDQIEDLDAAREMFQKLLGEYANTSYELEALYELYKLADLQGNDSEKRRFKQEILDKYPESQYAKILSDPDYLKRQREQEDKVQALYEQAFTEYRQGNFFTSAELCKQGEQEYPDAPLIPQFLLLKAMNYAEMGDSRNYRQTLERIVEKYPNSNQKTTAEEKLKALEETEKRIAHRQKQIYNYSTGKHFLAVAFRPTETDVSQLRFDILSFNLDHYEQQEMEVEIEELVASRKVLLVKTLQDLSMAQAYYSKLQNNKADYLKASSDYEAFLISTANYNTLKKDKNLSRYLEFFKKNYNLSQ